VYHSLFRPIKEKSFLKKSEIVLLKSNKEFEEISYNLEPFYISLPKFSDDEARNWFYNSTF
jgi:hypothetical protein